MIYGVALSLLLGFELSFYLLIIQTGVVEHYNSNLFILLPMFVGGVVGTYFSGFSWIKITNPVHKAIIALTLQLFLSFFYPNYSFITLFLLGITVGLMAPLGIYLFKTKQQKELFFALAIAYTIGTALFNLGADSRVYIAVVFSTIALFSAVILRDYKVHSDSKTMTYSIGTYIPLMLWILLDSNLFETLSRHEDIDIWKKYTLLIIAFHILGLVAAYFSKASKKTQHLYIALLFILSYSLSYTNLPILLAVVYPFVISYYNVIVFTTLSNEVSLKRLSLVMVFVGWIASGSGLAIALSRALH